MKKFLPSILIIFFSLDCFALKISGTVTDKSGAPVSDAMVKFVDSKNPSVEFISYTNSSGRYFIDETFPANNMSLYCYPNPFNRQTVISFHLDQKQRVVLVVYNIAGQRIRVIFSGDLDSGHHQIVWDGLSQRGTPVDAGTYICSLQGKKRASAKMVVQGGENIAVPVWSSEEEPPEEVSPGTSQIYSVSISGKDFKTHYINSIDLAGVYEKDFVIDRNVWTPFSTAGDYLGTYNGVDYTPVFIKGVNLGAAVPGSQPGQLAVSSEQYARWFRMIAETGFNTIRIYTLHFPRFYDEFARYNRENPGKPLYLLHGAWLNEEYYIPNSENDLYSLTEIFDHGIQEIIDCLHGNRTISYSSRPDKANTAYGQYKTDISAWVIGYVIGREIEAIEVGWTDFVHNTVTGYSGAHVSIDRASPTEAWSAGQVDKLIAYERSKYSTTRPVAFSSWPTLDPLRHPSDDPDIDGEDDESINLNKLNLIDAPGGYFVSYHAYPYYPNFINWDEKYQNVYDDEGLNNYIAYLRDLRNHYTNFPVLITEFGVPSSYGNARYSFSGMNHGGMTEAQQGNSNMRMLRNIYDTNYGGGVMFSWMDEWFKRTWITNPVVSGRLRLWHNICSPENNFGLLRFDPNPQYYNTKKTTNTTASSKTSKVDMWHDFTFLNMEASLKTPLANGDTLWFAIDTYKPNIGESTLPNGQKLIRNRAEFLLRVTPDSANLYVIKAYNLLGRGIVCGSFAPICDDGVTSFQTQTTDGEPWQLFRWQNGFKWKGREALPYMQDIGKLGVGFGNAALASHQCVQIRNNGIFIRIPWGMMNVSDPSLAEVVDDNVSVDLCCRRFACGMQYLKASKTDGINITMIYKREVSELDMYRWNNWDSDKNEILNPAMFIEAEKASLSIIREGLKNTPFTPKTK